jgi:hypothetical protein
MEQDVVNHPSHYTFGSVECIDAIDAALTQEGYRGYLKGCMMKYIWRYENKENPIQDLRKAQWYLTRLINTYGT